MTDIKKMVIYGLKNYRDIELKFDSSIKIIVGENGMGKTAILNVFYFILSKKWNLLGRIQFDFIKLTFTDFCIDFSQSELLMYINYINDGDGYTSECSIKKFTSYNNYLYSNYKNRIIYLPVFRNLDQLLAPFFGKNAQGLFDNIDQETRLFINETLIHYEMNDVSTKLSGDYDLSIIKPYIEVCNSYLAETKFVFENHRMPYLININNDEEVNLEHLSSGEKQIVHLFSKFYLSKRKDLILLVDEPELSLSINWQRKILQDVLKSKKCSFLFAITHSPFIFENQLDKYAEGINLSIML